MTTAGNIRESKHMLMPIIIIIIIFTAVYFLCEQGIGGINMAVSLMNMTSMDCKRSRFSHCSGYMKRIARFKEDRVYHFNLDLDLSRGDFWVELIDTDGTPLVRLDRDNLSASQEMSSNKRYRLIFHFRSASGSYRLEWD